MKPDNTKTYPSGIYRVLIIEGFHDFLESIDLRRGYRLPEGAEDDKDGFFMWTEAGQRVDFGGTGDKDDPNATVTITFHKEIDPAAPASQSLEEKVEGANADTGE